MATSAAGKPPGFPLGPFHRSSAKVRPRSRPDPVSWFLIEPGWKVVDAQGQEVGSVDEVVGDSSDDIFNGLSISTSLLGRPHYVASEQVGAITQGQVQLKLTKDQIEH